MSGNYVLKFSDPFKTSNITVPSKATGSGLNNYDTSLDLPGAGNENYGNHISQNFLKLLEHFSSPYPPENAIEGQLWYDTSNPNQKVLRVNNGTDTSSRWSAASGVYQQSNDPYVQFLDTVREGDIWVDTQNGQLKIRTGVEWRLVGPIIGSDVDKTGTEFEFVESNTGQTYPVIKNWANGNIVEIISYNSFVPKKVIPGFTSIQTGTNLTTKVAARYNGISEKAQGLVVNNITVLKASEILRNRPSTIQIHTGTLYVDSSSGLKVRNVNFNQNIEFYSGQTGGFINFTDEERLLTVGINDKSYLKFNPNGLNVGINTTTNVGDPTLDVFGTGRFTGLLTITEPNISLQVTGKSNFGNNVTVTGNLSISGLTTSTGKLTIGSTSSNGIILQPGKHDVYDIGSTSTRFRHIHAGSFGYSLGVGNTSTATTVFYGRLEGTATRLQNARQFRITGHVTSTAVTFNGGANVVFTTTLHRSMITATISTSSATLNHSMVVLNTGTSTSDLEVVSKSDFLKDVEFPTIPGLVPAGTVTAFGTNTNIPAGWLLCANSTNSPTPPTSTNYPKLYSVIGTTFGSSGPGTFFVPVITPAVVLNGSVHWIIKT